MGAEAEHVVVVVRPAADTAVVLVPFPAHGHISPMLRLARALAGRGVAAIVAVPDFVHRRLRSGDDDCGQVLGAVAGVELASMDSGVPDDGVGEPPGFAAFARAMEKHMPASLEAMLTARRGGVACLVADVLASWAVPVAARCGVPAVGFWPAMLATYRVLAAIPELIDKGLISDHGIPIQTKRLNIGEGDKVNGDHHQTGDTLHVLPAQLGLSTAELPWLVGDAACQKSRFAFWVQTMERAKSLRSILVNTFPVVEAAGAGDDGGGDTGTAPPQVVLRVGPLLPPTSGGIVVDGCITKGDDSPAAAPRRRRRSSKNNPSMWPADETCVDWLDTQRAGSVIYVAFGSWVASIGRDAIGELALGLAATARPFLWALKDEPSWRDGLPSGFAEGAGGRGKIVAWAPQEDVLRHGAVGCYLTHCGWNSTLEAIQHGVRLLCYPVSGDQFINCAHIVRVWGTGIRLWSTERSAVVDCVERVMEGEEGRRMQEKVDALRKRVMMGEARCAANRNLDAFVDGILMRNGHNLLAQPSPLTCPPHKS